MGKKFLLPDGLYGMVMKRDGAKIVKIWHKAPDTGDRELVLQMKSDLLSTITSKHAVIEDAIARSCSADTDIYKYK